MRGSSGDRRAFLNEAEIADHLATQRGFRIVDPNRADLPTIVETCAGARTVVGVEGSQLMHGVLALETGGSILALQPQDRFVPNYKHLADRDRQHFGFVVAERDGEDYRCDISEIERTLDLLPG